MSYARQVSPFKERLAAVPHSQRCDSCVMVTKQIVQPLRGVFFRVDIDVKRRWVGSMEPQEHFVHAGHRIIADFKTCPCSWSIEDDLSPETTHSSIDHRCLPF